MTPTSIDSLLECWEKLGPMERSVLNTLAWRLYAGQRKYGKLHENKKVWSWEAAEEGLDQAVYLAAALVSLTEEGKRRYFSQLDEHPVDPVYPGNPVNHGNPVYPGNHYYGVDEFGGSDF